MKKRLLFIVLAICLVFSLCLFAGCDNNQGDSSNVDIKEKYSEGLEFTLNDDGKSYSVTGIGTCSDTDIVIPAVYNERPVTSIGNIAFYNCDGLTSITIPNSVTFIDWGASLVAVA